MGLKFKPLSVSEHRNRWPGALVKLWEYSETSASVQDKCPDSPGKHRENIFDFHDGMRMVVSADRYPCGAYVHVSVSAPETSEAFVQTLDSKGRPCLQRLDKLVNERIRHMGGPGLTVGVVFHGIVHFYYPPLQVKTT